MANLINAGILPLTFADSDDYDSLQQGSVLTLNNLESGMKTGKLILNTGTKEIPLVCDLTDRQISIVKAGGLLNYTKENG